MKAAWCMRYRFRLAYPFACPSEEVPLTLMGRPAALRSHKHVPLGDTTDVVLRCPGFESEETAATFGEKVPLCISRAALQAGIGVDISSDYATHVLHINDKDVIDDKPGLIVFREGESILISGGTVNVTVKPSLEGFIEKLAGDVDAYPKNIDTAIELYCSAQMELSNAAKLILALSAIESLVGEEDRRNAELKLLEAAKRAVNNEDADSKSKESILSIIGQQKKRGFRTMGIEQVKKRLPDAHAAFIQIYNARNAIGHYRRSSEREQAVRLAPQAITLARRMIFSYLEDYEVSGRSGVS